MSSLVIGENRSFIKSNDSHPIKILVPQASIFRVTLVSPELTLPWATYWSIFRATPGSYDAFVQFRDLEKRCIPFLIWKTPFPQVKDVCCTTCTPIWGNPCRYHRGYCRDSRLPTSFHYNESDYYHVQEKYI